jgi:VWFA-related protein
MSATGRCVAALALALLAAASARGQGVEAEEVLKVDTSLVSLSVSVTDAKGRHRPGLRAADFHVTDEGRPVSLEFFDTGGPASLVFLVDTSTSMKGEKWQNLRGGLRKFLTSAHAGNDYTLIAFDDRPRLVASLVSAEELWRHFDDLSPSGHTALYDAVLLGLEALGRARQRHKALVLLSDGADNASSAGLADVRREVLAHRAAMYTIGVLLRPGKRLVSEREGHELLTQLAEATGGLVHFPESKELRDVLETISADLGGQYTLSYYPPDKALGWRRVQVSVAQEGERHLRLRYQGRYIIR